MSEYTYLRDGLGGYTVLLKDGLKRLGKVRKYEKRYNLRRTIVVRGWTAEDETGRTLGAGNRSGDPDVFATREDAAAALKDASGSAPVG